MRRINQFDYCKRQLGKIRRRGRGAVQQREEEHCWLLLLLVVRPFGMNFLLTKNLRPFKKETTFFFPCELFMRIVVTEIYVKFTFVQSDIGIYLKDCAHR